jgi:hypothetical protein
MNPIRRKILFYVLLPLVAGFLIYFFFRPSYWFVQWFEKREPLIDINSANLLQKIIIFSGPDFCWAFSICSALFIWQKSQGRPNKYFIILIFLLVALSELIQFLFSRGFTFDWIDFIAALAGLWLSYFLIGRNEKN